MASDVITVADRMPAAVRTDPTMAFRSVMRPIVSPNRHLAVPDLGLVILAEVGLEQVRSRHADHGLGLLVGRRRRRQRGLLAVLDGLDDVHETEVLRTLLHQVASASHRYTDDEPRVIVAPPDELADGVAVCPGSASPSAH